MTVASDLTGHRFGRLTAVKRGENDRQGHAMWECKCDCGATSLVVAAALRRGNSKSCGCRRKELKRFLRHGHCALAGPARHSKTYRSWAHMKARCDNPNVERYPLYGGRGITYDPRWSDFAVFLAEMGECPEGMSLDRYPDNDGNYEPGNCRWATDEQQARNTRTRRTLTAFGRSMTVAEWGEELGLMPNTIHQRLYKGDSSEDALRAVA